MTREEAHKLIDELFDAVPVEGEKVADETPARILPEGKRVVRTKSSGDSVYYIDEEKMTRQWVTNGDILTALGFLMEDVEEVDDAALLKYSMAAAIYKAPDADA